jgi:pectin methylesterase-like acyl-CoA thioesterase
MAAAIQAAIMAVQAAIMACVVARKNKVNYIVIETGFVDE